MPPVQLPNNGNGRSSPMPTQSQLLSDGDLQRDQSSAENSQDAVALEQAPYQGKTHVSTLPEICDLLNCQVTVESPSPSGSKKYAKVPQTGPFAPIQRIRQAAEDSAINAYGTIRESNPELVQEFEVKWIAWKEAWYSDKVSRSSNARDRCCCNEFHELFHIGPIIRPLVIYKLLDPGNWTGVFLYNYLENDKKYLIDPGDVINFLTMQLHNNLIVNINQGREW
ncbi:hypothetical protein F4808DRAFT_464809 [Astrocystis sublimbata]|nr:hypothetical protein F4808DRAFT_464809 [Astrocystis sublimbata]